MKEELNEDLATDKKQAFVRDI
jgi:hypothetical protein